MTLHEQYETLLRRGMPEHPRLMFGTQDKRNIYWEANDAMARPERIASAMNVRAVDDARDIITMHALRWMESNVSGFAVYIAGTGTRYAVRWEEGTDDYGGDGPSVLDAIIAATAHLEPA